jgi:hypothetical protein
MGVVAAIKETPRDLLPGVGIERVGHAFVQVDKAYIFLTATSMAQSG